MVEVFGREMMLPTRVGMFKVWAEATVARTAAANTAVNCILKVGWFLSEKNVMCMNYTMNECGTWRGCCKEVKVNVGEEKKTRTRRKMAPYILERQSSGVVTSRVGTACWWSWQPRNLDHNFGYENLPATKWRTLGKKSIQFYKQIHVRRWPIESFRALKEKRTCRGAFGLKRCQCHYPQDPLRRHSSSKHACMHRSI